MVKLLNDNPLLLLFLIAALSYPLGRLKIFGVSLGVAAVLFVGLAVGALDPNLKLPEIVYNLGLVVFVYTIGLSSGPGFFASFRGRGVRDNLLVVALLLLVAATVYFFARAFGVSNTVAAGLFTGALTNTPALAAALEFLKGSVPPAQLDAVLAEPVLGYSIAYPMGILGVMVVMVLFTRVWRVNYVEDALRVRDAQTSQQLVTRTLRITRPEIAGQTIQRLMQTHAWEVVFGRWKHAQRTVLATAQTELQLDDLVSVVGAPEQVERVRAALGEFSAEALELDRTEMDYRRIFVSNPQVVGVRLRDLNLPQQFGALITRVRRGDVEFLARDDTTLDLGDRVRVVTRRENMGAVSHFFGDSFKALGEIDVLSFSLGLALGILVGQIPIPLPGGIAFKLGTAGGPLVVALLLGTLERSGPIVWTLPFNANLTLRQIGLILFLAGVGTRAGYAFVSTLAQGDGLLLFGAGAALTMGAVAMMMFIGYRVLKIPMNLLLGMVAGMQTNPALLGFATQETENDLPNLGYATVYPMATILKIILAQALIIFLR
ncbi:MAG: transporter [Chloroflexi bacterium UTCFX4]|nr:MAG: transporter [Chloroflexi bacterium UTCFX4]